MIFSVAGTTVEWADGKLTGPTELVTAVLRRVASGEWCEYRYWIGPPSLREEFDAYVTVGATLSDLFDGVTVDTIPDNPAGYEEEGPVVEAAEDVL